MLLDDVMSELDATRRERLADLVRAGGQALITTTDVDHVPGASASDVIVTSVLDGTVAQSRRRARRMSWRRAPRSLSFALRRVTSGLAPATILARVQGCWAEAVGDVVSAEARPVSERDGTWSRWRANRRSGRRSSSCSAPTSLDKLNAALGDTTVAQLRFKAGDFRSRP